MNTLYRIFLIFYLSLFALKSKGQVSVLSTPNTVVGSLNKIDSQLYNETDLIDLGRKYILGKKDKRLATTEVKTTKLHISGVPAAGYTLETGFAGIITANGAFYTNYAANISSVLFSLAYSIRNQLILPLQASIWTRDNKFNILLDSRFDKFPTNTFGLGEFTQLNDGYMIDYYNVYAHLTVLRKIRSDIYAGLGYNFDYYWNIKELDAPKTKESDFQKYGLSDVELASGITLNFFYDTRANSINPEKGNFAGVIYRQNLSLLGNSTNWGSVVIDLRKYFVLPAGSKNILAFWNYEFFTFNGKAPYLMLPNTGCDPYRNLGRGYVQGRYRGSNMADLESEYRFEITNNGLLGGVVFADLQAFTMPSSNKFETILPGCGVGLRFKLNKFSRTNLALDYGFGIGGSGGIFVNLGEVF